MLRFIKYIIQLLLSPTNGWKDIKLESPDSNALLRQGLYPLIGIVAITEFLGFVYQPNANIISILARALTDILAYVLTLFIAKFIFASYLKRYSSSTPERYPEEVITYMGLGLLAVLQIIQNILPWHFVLLSILPLYIVLILYKSSDFMKINPQYELRYMVLAAVAIIVLPITIRYILSYLIA